MRIFVKGLPLGRKAIFPRLVGLQLTLIKFVLSSTPIYFIFLFKAPDSVCKSLSLDCCWIPLY